MKITNVFSIGQDRRLWSETSVSTLAAFAPMAAGLITAPITARAIGPIGRGFVATGLTWASLLALVFCLSLGQVAVGISSKNDKERSFSALVGTMGMIASAGAVLSWIVLLLLWMVSGGSIFGDAPLWVVATISLNIPFFLWNYFAVGLIQVKGLVRQLAIASLVATGLGLPATLLLVVVLKLGIVGVIASIGIGNGVLAVVQLGLIFRHCSGGPTWDKGLAIELIRSGIRLHPHALGIFLIAHSDILMLAHYSSAQEVGWYQLAVVLVVPLSLISQSMSSSIYSLVAREGPTAAWPQQKKLVFQVTVLTAVGMLVGIVLAGPVVRIVGGSAFLPAAVMLQILFLAAIPKAIPTVVGPQFVARGMFGRVSVVAVLAGVLNVSLNLWAIPLAGGIGAAWTTVGAYAFVLGGTFFNMRAFQAHAEPSKTAAPQVELDRM